MMSLTFLSAVEQRLDIPLHGKLLTRGRPEKISSNTSLLPLLTLDQLPKSCVVVFEAMSGPIDKLGSLTPGIKKSSVFCPRKLPLVGRSWQRIAGTQLLDLFTSRSRGLLGEADALRILFACFLNLGRKWCCSRNS